MTRDVTYKLDELAHVAGISARTVRYYVQRGLVPAPAFRGKDTAYGREHLVRLQAIKKLQDAFFPLDAIAVELERRSIHEIERIADGTAADLPVQRVTLPALETGDLPPTSSTSGVPLERVFRRIEIAPGVELSIADDAPRESRAIAEKILRGMK